MTSYPFDAVRFTYFSRASLDYIIKSGKKPDVLHIHNWETAIVGPLFWDIFVNEVQLKILLLHYFLFPWGKTLKVWFGYVLFFCCCLFIYFCKLIRILVVYMPFVFLFNILVMNKKIYSCANCNKCVIAPIYRALETLKYC